MGHGGGAWGPHMVHRGPTLLTCRARAVVSTQQAVQQMEKPRRSRTLLPKSSTTRTWRGGRPGKAGRLRSPRPHQTHPCPVLPSQEAPRPSRTPLLKGICEESPGTACPQGCTPEWPLGHSTAQSRGPLLLSCGGPGTGSGFQEVRAPPHPVGALGPGEARLHLQEPQVTSHERPAVI